MDKINITPENINDFYKKINDLIDDYFKWNIKASSLKNFLKPGSIALKKFINRNGLENINRIEIIINDVIEDRYSMEMDGVLTFENFNIKSIMEINSELEIQGTEFEFLLFNNVKKSNIEYEKIISDYYNISLGHITDINEELHNYNITMLNGDYDIIIFNKTDLIDIGNNILTYIIDYINKETITIKNINIDIELKHIINREDIESMVDSKEFILKVISEILNSQEYHYKDVYGKYYIWEK